MNTDNYNRFDELIREKLDSYEAEPDMDLLVNIHARKNRFLKSRNLLTIIALLAILMAGIIGGYYLSNGKTDQSQHAKDTRALSFNSPNGHSTDYPASAAWNSNSGKSTTGTSFSSIAQDQGSGFSAHTATHYAVAQTNQANRTTAHSTASLPATDVINKVNVALPDLSNTSAKFVVNEQTTETSDKTGEAAGKEKQDKTTDECSAAFEYYTSYDHSFNFLSSIAASADVAVKWQFGDGQTSNEVNPKHTYDKAGQYAVILTAVNTRTNCKAEVYKLVRVVKDAAQTSSSIKGTVFADAEYAAKIMVQLISAESGQVVQSTITNNKGLYEFNEIGSGSYLIRTTGYKHYETTFYGNTSESELATNIAIFKDDYESFSGYDIQMVAGNHATGNNQSQLDSGSRLMIVLDENNNPLTTVVVNANGTITSSVKLPAGNYNMLDAQSGKPGGGLNVGNDGSLGSQPRSGNGLSEGISEVKLSPNPASNYVNVGLTNANTSPLEVTIINYAGAIVKQFTLPNGSSVSSIDINSLSSGTYHVIVKQNGIAATSTLIKGSDNSK